MTATDLDRARARAHPVRLALLELLAAGPSTATAAASALGSNSGTTSFHLRRLAEFGLVEPATGGSHRERRWRLTTQGTALDELDRRDDERFRRWRERRPAEPARWRRQDAGSYRLHLTAAEADEVAGRILDAVQPYFDREHDPAARPRGSRPVALVTRLFPLVDER